MTLEFPRYIFEKYSNIKFHENPSSGSRVDLYGRTDRHDEANSRCSQFCERAKQNCSASELQRLGMKKPSIREMPLKADSHIACRAHAAPMQFPCPCRAAKGLECVFPIWFTQCGHVWFTLAHAMPTPRPCHALTMPWPWEERHGQSTAWSEHGMVRARHGQSTAWAWHGKCESDTAALCKSNGKDTF